MKNVFGIYIHIIIFILFIYFSDFLFEYFLEVNNYWIDMCAEAAPMMLLQVPFRPIMPSEWGVPKWNANLRWGSRGTYLGGVFTMCHALAEWFSFVSHDEMKQSRLMKNMSSNESSASKANPNLAMKPLWERDTKGPWTLRWWEEKVLFDILWLFCLGEVLT